MPEPETATPATPALSVPATPANGAAAPENAFDLGKWRASLDERHTPAFEKYADDKYASQVHGLQTEVGRLKKASDPAIVARYGQVETIIERLRSIAVRNYGADVADDLKGIDTIEALDTALYFLEKGRGAAPKAIDPTASMDAATKVRWAAFQAQEAVPPVTRGEANKDWHPTNGSAMPSRNASELIRRYADGEPLSDAEKKQLQDIRQAMGVR